MENFIILNSPLVQKDIELLKSHLIDIDVYSHIIIDLACKGYKEDELVEQIKNHIYNK